jgi:hypothetical protein
VTGEEAGKQPQEMMRVRRKIRKGDSHHRQRQQPRQRDRQGQKKARYLMYFVTSWIIVLGLAAVGLKRMWPDEPPKPSADYEEKDPGLSEEDLGLLQEHTEDATKHFKEFLAAPDPAARSVHVLRPEQTVSRMVRYYEDNPQLPDEEQINPLMRNLIHTPAGPAIETLWRKESGKIFEAVFFEEKGDWKLDWDAFVRSCSEPWGLFLTGEGEGDGSFRVLARERLGATGRSAETIGLVLTIPREGRPGEATLPSPEIRVVRATPLGRAIEEAFAARAQNRGAFRSRTFGHDPQEMIRLHVKLKRSGGGDEERKFEITELLAPHWLELPFTPIKAEAGENP